MATRSSALCGRQAKQGTKGKISLGAGLDTVYITSAHTSLAERESHLSLGHGRQGICFSLCPSGKQKGSGCLQEEVPHSKVECYECSVWGNSVMKNCPVYWRSFGISES